MSAEEMKAAVAAPPPETTKQTVTVEVPIATCDRCAAKAPARPTAIMCTGESEFVAAGSTLPRDWTFAYDRVLCAGCNALLKTIIEHFVTGKGAN